MVPTKRLVFKSSLRVTLVIATFLATVLQFRSLPENVEPEIIPEAPFPLGVMTPLYSKDLNETIAYRHSNFHVEFPLCLVHVGKAAGSSVSCGLGLSYANCEGMPRETLPHTYFFHMRRKTCPPNSRTYLVTLRNPLTRLQSWFDFEKAIVPSRGMNSRIAEQVRRQRALLFQECYTTFESFALEGLKPLEHLNVTASDIEALSCPQRAWAAALGARAFSYHEWYNYEYYWLGIHASSHDFLNHTRDSPRLLALRMEHILNDWTTVSLEPMFRAVNRRRESNETITNTTRQHDNTVLKNPTAVKNLCRALCMEIQCYKQFLLAARNLDDSQRQESLQEVQDYCPVETSWVHRDCLEIPKFPKMKIPRRQYRTEVKKRFYEPI